MTHQNIGIIILAAGASSRLGQPKQLLPYNHKTLLQHTLYAAAHSTAATVVVVLGAHASLVNKEIPKCAHIVVNTHWQEGMASSIRCGLTLLMATPGIDGAIIMLCDQPYVSSELLDELIHTAGRTGKDIIASSYNDTLGVPALFRKNMFPHLLALSGDGGAKPIIQKHMHSVYSIPFSKGEIDIDTLEQYVALQRQQ